VISLMFLALGATLVLRSELPEVGAFVLGAGALIQGFMGSAANNDGRGRKVGR
jgi:hypothetical protein